METRAIAGLQELSGWQAIPIIPKEEKLVSLSCLSGQVLLHPYYYRRGIPGAINDVLLREGVVDLVATAAKRLPKNVKFIVFDGWRPLKVQTYLFHEFEQRLKPNHPELGDEQLYQLVKTYVSLPSIDPNQPSPHLTGGSIDLGLVDEYGNLLDLGTPFDDFSDASNTDFYEFKELTDTEKSYRDYRRLLYYTLTEVGFTNYHKEWWHFDFGNQFWASCSKADHAFYGLASTEV